MLKDKKNILLVEDEQDIMLFMLKGLISRRRMEYNAFVAIDGYEGLETLEHRPIDCMVLDLNMANFNGLQLLQEMHAKDMLKNVSIIISSGYIDESMELQLKTFNVDAILKKPYSINKLITTIDELMRPVILH